MSDLDFIAALSREWQRDTQALEVSRRAAVRQLRMNRLALAVEFAFGAIGLWGAWYFWHQDGTVYTVSALVMLAAVTLGYWGSLRERVPLSHWHDWSPDGVLAYRIRLCESTLRIAASCKYSAGFLLAFLAYIWVAALMDPESLPRFFPAFYTAVIVVTVIALLAWAKVQRGARTRELAQLQALRDQELSP